VIALGLAAVLFGCATSGVERRERVASSLQETRDYVARARTQVPATMTALNGLPGKSGDALTAQYRVFVREFDQLQSLANNLGSQAAKVREQGNEQLKAWQEEAATLQDPKLRERADARRMEQAKRYDAFAAEVAQTERTLSAYLTDLRDIRRFLDADLTPQGVSAVQDKIVQAGRDMNPVMQSLARLNDGLTTLAERVEPGGAPAAGSTAGASPRTPEGSASSGTGTGAGGTSTPSRQPR
jgi:hypothetical protein